MLFPLGMLSLLPHSAIGNQPFTEPVTLEAGRVEEGSGHWQSPTFQEVRVSS